MDSFKPVYLSTFSNGNLRKKINEAKELLRNCDACPRYCMVNRLENETAYCKTGSLAKVASYGPHYSEEKPLVGTGGSGTIFFTHCNLLCNFCQNFDISHEGDGKEVTPTELGGMMLRLQQLGCHNINFVTPSHVFPQILEALEIAIKNGLKIPLVYNTSCYDKKETIEILDGIIDIYLPDFKFWDPESSRKTCNAGDYPIVARQALKEMYRQVGDLQISPNGLATRGLLVRHLVMPNDFANTREVMEFIVNEISPNTYVNIMNQYRPMGNASITKEINVEGSLQDYILAIKMANEEGITRLNSDYNIKNL